MAVNEQLVQKHGELFVVCDERGDISPSLTGAGLYFRDMRHLSHLAVSLTGQRLELLDSGSQAIDRLETFLTNTGAGGDPVPAHAVTVARSRDLGERLIERISVTNHTRGSLRLPLTVEIGGDFLDMFAVRGFFEYEREHGPEASVIEDGMCELRYASPDGTRYVTRIHVPGSPEIDRVDAAGTPVIVFSHDLAIGPAATVDLVYEICPEVAPAGRVAERPVVVTRGASEARTEIITSSETFNAILRRSLADLEALTTPLPGGSSVIAAGIPWYVAPFGRDSLITARQALWLDPALLSATLRLLASVQGERHDRARDEAPGKIVHEMRLGEMSRRDLVPFSRYYGTVDATPLFLVMLAEYVIWTGDVALFRELRENVYRALDWIDTSGDTNRDGFVDYERQAERGLVNQGWKDSWDSLQHLDGSPVPGPVALVEVQGYVYAAKTGAATCFEALGDVERAARLRREAEVLRGRVENAYWMDGCGYYAEAIDGMGRRAESLVSNQGHLLASGAPGSRRAESVTRSLLSDEMRSGWGIRTLATTMPHYNPVSYHRGSVWPHDNAFLLWGFRRYRHLDALDRLATELFDAAARFPLYRLPELLCGYERADDPWATPVSYPTTCSPQAWAAGVPLVIIETLLGLRADGAAGVLALDPWLPDWLQSVRLTSLAVGAARIDLEVSGAGSDVEVVVHANPDGIEVRREPNAATEP